MPSLPLSHPGRTLAWRAVCAAAVAGGAAALFAAAPRLAEDVDFLGLTDRTIHFVGHIVVFGALALLILAALGGRFGLAWLVANVLAGAEELHQLFVPGRRPAVQDVILNIAAVTLALSVAYLVIWWRGRTPAKGGAAASGPRSKA